LDTETKPGSERKPFADNVYDSNFINEYGRIESLRASRYNTSYSIVLISVENGSKGRNGTDFDSSHEFVRALASRVVESVRNCDIVGRADEKRLLVILPEADYFGSLMTVRKLSKSIEQISDEAPFPIIITQATFPRDGKTFPQLMGKALTEVELQKESLWEKLGLKNKLFWEVMGELTNMAPVGYDNSCFEAGTDRHVTEFFMDQLDELIVKEISRAPQKRGILYFSAKRISQRLPLVKNLNAAGAFSTRVFLVGEPEDGIADIHSAAPITLDDPRLRETFFTFYLTEGGGYALICKENWGATYSCFHTADEHIVKGLITKFQSEYSLQEQLG